MNFEEIIPDQNVLKKYLSGATTALTVEHLSRYLKEAYRMNIIPVVGKEQMAALNATDPEHAEAVDLLREALVNYAVFNGFDRLSVRFSTSGVQQVSSESSRPAPLETKANARLEFEKAAHSALEFLIGLLEDGAKSVFAAWSASSVYKQLTRTFFHTSQQFNQAQSATVARDGFLALVPTIARVELSSVRPIIPAVFDSLKAKQKASTSLTFLEETLLEDYIRPAVGLLTIGEGLYARAVVMNLEGTITQFDNSTANRQRGARPADPGLIADLYKTSIARGQEMLARMMDFVLQNAEDLGYVIPENPTSHPLETLNKSTDRIYAF
ncbi:DUF6712 family protein [Siphonobacter sp.]|uniref:DUF6712 family protein n=1 Tax=Siphonobacter sp. TaxID=1869184 RepID=UPI003B3AD233